MKAEEIKRLKEVEDKTDNQDLKESIKNKLTDKEVKK